MDDRTAQASRSSGSERITPKRVAGSLIPAHLSGLNREDILQVQIHWADLLGEAGGEIQQAGEILLERIAHPNWSVEWNLPRWLGVRAGLSDDEQQRLILANVAGLGYIRLADDARDGEYQAPGSDGCSALERILFEASKSEYRDLVGGDAWFWEQFESCLDVWHRAALPQLAGAHFPQHSQDLNQGLEDFGAPLFICCAAASLLAHDIDGYDTVIVPVRHYLRAAVVYDHFKDWSQDLQAGRDNLFVQAQIAEQGTGANTEAIRRNVELAMLDGRSMEAYIQRIRMELDRAVQTAHIAGMPQFARHLAGLECEIERSGIEMLNGLGDLLDHALGVLMDGDQPNRIR